MQRNSTMRVLVTGGTGFIGKNLVSFLQKKGITTYVLSRKKGGKFTVSGDLLEPLSLKKAIQKIKPTHVFHLAAYGTKPEEESKEKMFAVNVLGTQNLLNALVAVPTQNIILTGSSAEYGKSDNLSENVIAAPNTDYGASKLAQTILAYTWAKQNKRKLAVCRLFGVYGQGEGKWRLIPRLLKSLITRKTVLLATGKEAGDYLFIDDVVRGLFLAATKNKESGAIYNIASGKQTAVLPLIQLVEKITKKKILFKKNAYPGRPWDRFSMHVPIEKAKKTLGFVPAISLQKGLLQYSSLAKK